MFRTGNGCRGFSLVEALVALAIAAALTAALTRLVTVTRVNAAAVGELTEMAALGETLLARIPSSQNLQSGRTDGRRGAFAWRIDIGPASFTALARRTSEKRAPESGASEPRRMPAAFRVGDAPAPVPPPTKWVAYRVTVVIEAPSGRTYAVDTIRIGPQPEAGDR
jgi:prepilin-type N-terminal cleavage/methylation domain-containing protein